MYSDITEQLIGLSNNLEAIARQIRSPKADVDSLQEMRELIALSERTLTSLLRTQMMRNERVEAEDRARRENIFDRTDETPEGGSTAPGFR